MPNDKKLTLGTSKFKKDCFFEKKAMFLIS